MKRLALRICKNGSRVKKNKMDHKRPHWRVPILAEKISGSTPVYLNPSRKSRKRKDQLTLSKAFSVFV